ncbi:ClpP-like prohead protease/major capsid protein fusion protein [Bradyrhizobium sp. BTAi1]|uniref:ClpP-like prohead protease/major capsid protein fusion protein n=1 Tax=Bradyrhizobium sp. (strain BTAi1 / ATCC BAA-1182) TaxID=288000 RepID=UPI00005DFB77|nr:ClpP-like prohead protease/major capsid protein fusion protein [Bradyrhizobium sp. BTAi1]ABQ38500.1 ATP-dependent Clp protease proteolytic subunit ClpP [Bradyrhizobium sp. BTAi1]
MAETQSLVISGQIYLYGDVGDPWGWGDGFTAEQVAKALVELGGGDATVRINSGGGIATEGMAIYSLLKAHPGKITVAIDGIAASAASLIAMAGDEIEMRTGAMMMIHDPSGYTRGPAKVHEDAAAFLHKLADNYASVYAIRAGMDAKEVRKLMLATTWLTAGEAVTQGFATKQIDEPATAMAAYDYRVYASAPEGLPVRVRDESNAAIAATKRESKTMTPEEIAAANAAANATAAVVVPGTAAAPAAPVAAAAPAAEAGKSWAAGFYASAGNSGLTLADLNTIVAASASHEQAKDALIAKLSAERTTPNPAGGHGTVSMGLDATEKFVTGATAGILAKLDMAGGERNEFTGRRLFELARMSLDLRGVRLRTSDELTMIGTAMQSVVMSGALSTSDFVNILANVAHKSMLKGYEEAEETFQKWTGTGVLTDFKTATRVDLGVFPVLDQVNEGAEYKYAKLTDRGVTLALATFGKMFSITRQSIKNDDLNAFSKVPMKMGRAAKRTVGNLVYGVLTVNANMADGKPLFHTAHGNLATGAGSVMSADSLDAGRAAMAKQVDPDANAVALNIRPSFLLTPVAMQGKAHQFMASQSEPGQNNAAVANRVANMAEVISDARLDVNSATAWYLAGSPSQYDTIEVDYLDGVAQPVLEQREGWNVDGVEFKVRHDAGVNLLDYRALYKSAGA